MPLRKGLPHSTIAIVGRSEVTQYLYSLVSRTLGERHRVVNGPDLPSVLEQIGDDDNLGLITVTLHDDGLPADHPLVSFVTDPRFRHTRILVLSTAPSISGLDLLTDLGRLDMLAYTPEIKEDTFIRTLLQQLRRYWHHRSDEDPTVGFHDELPEHFVLDTTMSDIEIIKVLIDAADHHLGYQPRLVFPPGVYLTKEGHAVEEMIFALSGKVLLGRITDAGDITMHHASTGKVIGLLALANARVGFFTARTTTEVVAVQLSYEQLNYLLSVEPRLNRLITALFVRTYDRRLRRAEDIQVKRHETRSLLEQERAALALALKNLEGARKELMSQARFASLGELAAGVAHELNNPMAAIKRTAEHLADDIEALLNTGKAKRWSDSARAAIDAASSSHAVSTKRAREIRREIAEITGDRELASRLVLAGVHDLDFVRQVHKSRNLDFEMVEHAASIGTALRNVENAATRITDLVASLRSYARPDGDPVTDVDIHQGIDDTIRLTSHKLRGVTVRRDYAELPPITCTPGQLAQVWTNLITNSAEAFAESGKGSTITVRTSRPRPDWVQVEVIDDGPGIPGELLDRLFEPRFTTKHGQVRFGMGIGLGVCRTIVSKHNGTINIETSTAGTRVIVGLPVAGPLSLQES